MLLKHFVINTDQFFTLAYFCSKFNEDLDAFVTDKNKINLARIKYLFERSLFFYKYICVGTQLHNMYPLAKPAHLPAELPNAGE